TVSPIRTSPEVIDSRPATMRKVVVLPQPEGPTRTTNSLSPISRLTSLTAWTVPSNTLLTCRMLTSAMGSPLDRAGEPGDVVVDEERVDQRDRDRADERAGHQRPPVEHVAADQFGDDADRHGLLLRGGEEHQRVDELVPAQREGEDAGRQDAGHRDGEDDV